MSVIEFANTSQVFSSERFSAVVKSAAELIRSSDLDDSTPEDVNDLLVMLEAVVSGRRVEIVPPHSELTLEEAADILLVSEPFLMQLLDSGKIPHKKDGDQYRILSDDLLTYKAERKRLRLQTVDELVEEGQLMNPDY